jgi:hypothetical protein
MIGPANAFSVTVDSVTCQFFLMPPSRYIRGLHFVTCFLLLGTMGLVLANKKWAKATLVWNCQSQEPLFLLTWWLATFKKVATLSVVCNHCNEEHIPADPLGMSGMHKKQILLSPLRFCYCFSYSIVTPSCCFPLLEKPNIKIEWKEHILNSSLGRGLIGFLISHWSYGEVTFPDWLWK